MEDSVDRSSLIGDAILYTLNQEVYLRRYLEDGHLSIDNNSAERALKNFAVGRRNWLFAKSVRGADASALVYSITETALLNHLNLSKSQTGMILIMEGLRDEWKQRDIDKLQKELRLLVAPDFIESDPFKIELVAPEFKVEDIVLVNEILDLRYAKIDAEIFDNAQKSRIIYSDKEGKNDIVEENYEKPLLCGNLKAEIYFFLRDSANLSDAESGYNFRFAQRILDTYCGIKIYRDNFRVKPYGDIGNDWLLLLVNLYLDNHKILKLITNEFCSCRFLMVF